MKHNIMSKIRYTTLSIALMLTLLFSACADSEFSRYRCYLMINNNILKDITLASAMNAAAPGIFCRISMEGTARFKFESNQGGTPTYSVMTSIDKNSKWMIGVYNGIIVGYGNDQKFHAYDNQCKNCYESSGLTRYALTMNTDGTAVCKSCHRVYDLNNNGNITKGDKGDGLIRYRTNANPVPYGVLSVNN